MAQPSAPVSAPATRTYDGRSGSLDVEPPRIDQSIEIDGKLDEAVWSQAARAVRDSRATRRSTARPPTTRPMCSSGIRRRRCTSAFAPRRPPARCARRSPIAIASSPTITSSSFSAPTTTAARRWCSASIRSACSSTARSRKARAARAAASAASRAGRETPDLSPDFVFQSKGRVTEAGYEVEVRIPFKSLRYQSQPTAGLGHSRHARRAAPGHRGQLGAGQARRSVVSRAGRDD